jgi:ABC-2 type transport system permease protein
MLWHKAWLESRGRFFVCLAMCLLPSLDLVFWQKTLLPGDIDGPQLYLKNLHTHHMGLSILWVLAAVLLGLGGLVREKAIGSSSLTLSLPVSRTYLIAVRICVGIAQAMALAVVPWNANLVISLIRGMPYSLSQAANLVFLLVTVGMVCFAAGVFVSSLVEGEYTAAALAYAPVVLQSYLFGSIEQLKKMDIFVLVTGSNYVDKQTYLFAGALPWSIIFGSILVSALMVFASVVVTDRREFGFLTR